jgi:hypothetical protein
MSHTILRSTSLTNHGQSLEQRQWPSDTQTS